MGSLRPLQNPNIYSVVNIVNVRTAKNGGPNGQTYKLAEQNNQEENGWCNEV